MGYAIFRLAKRTSVASAAKMIKHGLREDAVPNAIEGAPKPVNASGQGYGHGNGNDALAALRSKIEGAKKVRAGWQKTSVAALDILVTASRSDMLSWSLQRQNSYFTKALAFIADKFGGKENILAAVIHRDESTPHMQVILAPVDAAGRFSASKMMGGRQQLSQLQDDFHLACGAPFDLERGIKGSKAKHVPVQAFYGAMEAGLEPPGYVEVPPVPTMVDNLKGTYKAKKEAHEAALAKNAAIRLEVSKQAERGRAVHPAAIKRQAELYRENLATLATIKAQDESIKTRAERLDRQAVKIENESSTLDRHKAALDGEVRQAMGSIIGIVDRFSSTIQPEYRAMLAKELGVELGKGKLLDQIRRAGLASTAQESLELLDKVTSGEFSRAARAQANRDAPGLS
jgi:hypothetical protein